MPPGHVPDDHWTNLRALLRSDPHAYVGTETACRRVLEAVRWIDRAGAQWRLLATDDGNGHSIDTRFARWGEQGVWERMLAHCANHPAMEPGILDRTMVRAHPCAAGVENNGTQDEQALGRRRGGVRTQIHVLGAGLGNPWRRHLRAGHSHASPHAAALVAGLTCARVRADRGYAGHAVIDLVVARGGEVGIPPHQRSNQPRNFAAWWYQERHVVACICNTIKHVRRLFSRFDKLAHR